MYNDEPPFFKRTILPWYHSSGVCICVILIMAALIGFSVIGIQVASDLPAWYKLKVMPYALLILSILGLIINLSRLIQRNFQQLTQSRKRY